MVRAWCRVVAVPGSFFCGIAEGHRYQVGTLRKPLHHHDQQQARIQLPPPGIKTINNAILHRRVEQLGFCDTAPIGGYFVSLGTLEIRLVSRSQGEATFNSLHNEYHYLGFSRPVGEHLKYLVSCGDRPIACMAWNSGSLKLDSIFHCGAYAATNWLEVGITQGRNRGDREHRIQVSKKAAYVYPLSGRARERLCR